MRDGGTGVCDHSARVRCWVEHDAFRWKYDPAEDVKEGKEYQDAVRGVDGSGPQFLFHLFLVELQGYRMYPHHHGPVDWRAGGGRF